MNEGQQFKGTYINTRRSSESVVTSLWLPSAPEQHQSTFHENTFNSSTLQPNTFSSSTLQPNPIKTNNKIYKSEILINQTPTMSIDVDIRSLCDKCKRLIDVENEREVRFNNRHYHLNCLKCSNCQINLNNSTNNRYLLNDNGEPLCSKCQYSQAKLCYICHEAILDQEIITLDQNSYHKTCFNCSQCRKGLTDQTNLRIWNSKVCCFQCYSQYFAPQCSACFQPIISEKQTNFDGKSYHFDCFRCGQCNEMIIDQELSRYNNKPCCIQCQKKLHAPDCEKCLKKILNEKFPVLNGKKYHPECFRCHHCEKMIIDQEFSTDNEIIYCKQCYLQYLAPKCFQCSKSIPKGRALIFNDNKYHPECFRCHHCEKMIIDQEFSIDNENIYCKQCYLQYLTPKCFQCSKSISIGKSLKYDGKSYHPECFRCIQCNQIINETKFHTHKSKPCCTQCFNQYFAPKCAECLKIISIGKSIIYDGKSYHPDCFRCNQCKVILNNSAFHTHQSKAYCAQCYQNYFTLRCEKCSQVILDRYTTFQGKHFHIQCFSCEKCHRIIKGKDKLYNGPLGILCSTCAI